MQKDYAATSSATSVSPKARRWPVLLCSAALVALDFIFGPAFAMPALYVFPVIWAAWSIGLLFSCLLACAFCLLRFVSHWAWGFPFEINPAVINNLLRSTTFILVACLTARIAHQLRHQHKRIHQLERQLIVCTSCSLVRQPDGNWMDLDQLHSDDNAHQLLCPECERKRYGISALE